MSILSNLYYLLNTSIYWFLNHLKTMPILGLCTNILNITQVSTSSALRSLFITWPERKKFKCPYRRGCTNSQSHVNKITSIAIRVHFHTHARRNFLSLVWTRDSGNLRVCSKDQRRLLNIRRRNYTQSVTTSGGSPLSTYLETGYKARN